jgi:hypothetical protein
MSTKLAVAKEILAVMMEDIQFKTTKEQQQKEVKA